jgi:CHAD domain-containing protein
VGKPLLLELRRIAKKLKDAAEDVSDEAPATDERQRERGWRWAMDARVARRAQGLNDAISRAGAIYIPERLHNVRIAVKKLRYAIEVAADATGEDYRAELATLKRGQDTLGHLHDLQVLIDRVRQSQACLKTPDLSLWREFDALLAGLEKACRRLHARYVRERSGLAGIAARHSGKATRAKAPARRAG